MVSGKGFYSCRKKWLPNILKLPKRIVFFFKLLKAEGGLDSQWERVILNLPQISSNSLKIILGSFLYYAEV